MVLGARQVFLRFLDLSVIFGILGLLGKFLGGLEVVELGWNLNFGGFVGCVLRIELIFIKTFVFGYR